jgi:hypothetical protein
MVIAPSATTSHLGWPCLTSYYWFWLFFAGYVIIWLGFRIVGLCLDLFAILVDLFERKVESNSTCLFTSFYLFIFCASACLSESFLFHLLSLSFRSFYSMFCPLACFRWLYFVLMFYSWLYLLLPILRDATRWPILFFYCVTLFPLSLAYFPFPLNPLLTYYSFWSHWDHFSWWYLTLHIVSRSCVAHGF